MKLTQTFIAFGVLNAFEETQSYKKQLVHACFCTLLYEQEASVNVNNSRQCYKIAVYFGADKREGKRKREDGYLKGSEGSCSWIRPCGGIKKDLKNRSLPSVPRKVLNIETARARQVDCDASWEMKSICPIAAAVCRMLEDKGRRGREGGVEQDGRKEGGNLFCSHCIL